MSGTKDFTPKTQSEEASKCLTDDEIIRFFEACKNTRYNELFQILLHTGMRIGEACALEWADINFEDKTIHVYKTLNRVKVYYDENGDELDSSLYVIQITTPKKPASNRIIPMNEEVIEVTRV